MTRVISVVQISRHHHQVTLSLPPTWWQRALGRGDTVVQYIGSGGIWMNAESGVVPSNRMKLWLCDVVDRHHLRNLVRQVRRAS